jgi:hypothetical protein
MADLIDRWSQDSMTLVGSALEYAKANVYDAQADANIRAVRVMCNVLLQAAAQAAVPRPLGTSPQAAPLKQAG